MHLSPSLLFLLSSACAVIAHPDIYERGASARPVRNDYKWIDPMLPHSGGYRTPNPPPLYKPPPKLQERNAWQDAADTLHPDPELAHQNAPIDPVPDRQTRTVPPSVPSPPPRPAIPAQRVASEPFIGPPDHRGVASSLVSGPVSSGRTHSGPELRPGPPAGTLPRPTPPPSPPGRRLSHESEMGRGGRRQRQRGGRLCGMGMACFGRFEGKVKE
ncbi:hypothetical protein MMC30_006172 [Trapelia coarctata]|nr:hypothetical protein [Trapelia coarctata]